MTEVVPFFDLGALVARNKKEILTAFEGVVDSGIFIGGSAVTQFEDDFSNYLKSPFFKGVGNGLDAIRIGLEALGVGPGDEVVVPGFSFYATWLAVVQAGATPVFADVDETTGNLDPQHFEACVTSKTKAVIVVHLFGNPAQILEISAIAQANNMYVIEDCAQAHGAEIAGLKVGTIGEIGAFSFYPTKNLGALGDAGGIATKESRVADLVTSKRSYGQGQTKYDHIDLGWNSRLDPIQAAFLINNLLHLDEWNTRRREIASYYLSQFEAKQEQVIGFSDPAVSVWHHFVLRTQNRNETAQLASSVGVTTDIHYPYAADRLSPMLDIIAHRQPTYSLENANELANKVLSFPIGPWMTDNQVEQVGIALKAISKQS